MGGNPGGLRLSTAPPAQLTARIWVAHVVRVRAAVRLGRALHSAHVLTYLYEAQHATVRALVLGLLIGAGVRLELSFRVRLGVRLGLSL